MQRSEITSPNSFNISPALLCMLYVLAIMPSKAFKAIRNKREIGSTNKVVPYGWIQINTPVAIERKIADQVIIFAVRPILKNKVRTGFNKFWNLGLILYSEIIFFLCKE